MSQENESNIPNFVETLESFEKLELLFHKKPVDFSIVSTKLNECSQKIMGLLIEEGEDSVHLTQLNQLKTQVLKLMEIVHLHLKNKHTRSRKSLYSRKSEQETHQLTQSFIENPKVSGLSGIAGLHDVKKLLKSLVILPRTQPQLFENRRNVNSVLLFGPPGTGKTKLVHALAAEGEAILYSVSAGDILSSLVGESEKTLQCLFTEVRNSHKFTILFIDEIDSISKKRKESDQDYSRRIKTEFMCQMSKIENCRNMFVFCATNCPWDLDTAILRRFQKRIYISLPNKLERMELLRLFTKSSQLEYTADHMACLLEKTEGYSGSDMSDIVEHALNIPLTELEDTKLWKRCPDGYIEPIVSVEDFEESICCALEELPCNSVRVRQVNIDDFLNAADSIHLTVSPEDIKKYELFNNP